MNIPGLGEVDADVADALGIPYGQTESPARKHMKTRPLYEIAAEISYTWPRINYAARPYLQAMSHLGSVHEQYLTESAKSVVLYFLSNASSWRGEDARRIKAELKGMVK